MVSDPGWWTFDPLIRTHDAQVRIEGDVTSQRYSMKVVRRKVKVIIKTEDNSAAVFIIENFVEIILDKP